MEQNKPYVCNGLNPNCRKTACYYLGNGECRHTFDERYAINKEKQTDEPVQNTIRE